MKKALEYFVKLFVTSRNPILILLTLLLNLNLSTAQSPYFLQDGTKWMYYTNESTEPNMSVIHSNLEEDLVLGDTSINSVTYKKLYVRQEDQAYSPMFGTTFYSFNGPNLYYLRHDTIARKMYLFSDTSIAEILLWDFALNVGDTVPLAMDFGNSWVIDSVEQMILFGRQTTKFYLRDPYNPPGTIMPDNYYVEGMGGFNGLTFFKPVQIVVSGGLYMTRLQCFEKGDSIYPNYFGAACPQFTGIDDNLFSEFNCKVFPNPAAEGFYIQSKTFATSKNMTFELTDLSGRLVYRKDLKSSIEYISPYIFKGFYIWRVIEGSNLKAQGKIVMNLN